MIKKLIESIEESFRRIKDLASFVRKGELRPIPTIMEKIRESKEIMSQKIVRRVRSRESERVRKILEEIKKNTDRMSRFGAESNLKLEKLKEGRVGISGFGAMGGGVSPIGVIAGTIGGLLLTGKLIYDAIRDMVSDSIQFQQDIRHAMYGVLALPQSIGKWTASVGREIISVIERGQADLSGILSPQERILIETRAILSGIARGFSDTGDILGGFLGKLAILGSKGIAGLDETVSNLQKIVSYSGMTANAIGRGVYNALEEIDKTMSAVLKESGLVAPILRQATFQYMRMFSEMTSNLSAVFGQTSGESTKELIKAFGGFFKGSYSLAEDTLRVLEDMNSRGQGNIIDRLTRMMAFSEMISKGMNPLLASIFSFRTSFTQLAEITKRTGVDLSEQFSRAYQVFGLSTEEQRLIAKEVGKMGGDLFGAIMELSKSQRGVVDNLATIMYAMQSDLPETFKTTIGSLVMSVGKDIIGGLEEQGKSAVLSLSEEIAKNTRYIAVENAVAFTKIARTFDTINGVYASMKMEFEKIRMSVMDIGIKVFGEISAGVGYIVKAILLIGEGIAKAIGLIGKLIEGMSPVIMKIFGIRKEDVRDVARSFKEVSEGMVGEIGGVSKWVDAFVNTIPTITRAMGELGGAMTDQKSDHKKIEEIYRELTKAIRDFVSAVNSNTEAIQQNTRRGMREVKKESVEVKLTIGGGEKREVKSMKKEYVR